MAAPLSGDRAVILLEELIQLNKTLLDENKKLQDELKRLGELLEKTLADLQVGEKARSTASKRRGGRRKAREVVPTRCRRKTRTIYANLLKKDDFAGFRYDESINSTNNTEIQQRVLEAVLHDQGGEEKCPWSRGTINGGINRYFILLTETKKKQDDNKYVEHKKRSRKNIRRREVSTIAKSGKNRSIVAANSAPSSFINVHNEVQELRDINTQTDHAKHRHEDNLQSVSNRSIAREATEQSSEEDSYSTNGSAEERESEGNRVKEVQANNVEDAGIVEEVFEGDIPNSSPNPSNSEVIIDVEGQGFDENDGRSEVLDRDLSNTTSQERNNDGQVDRDEEEEQAYQEADGSYSDGIWHTKEGDLVVNEIVCLDNNGLPVEFQMKQIWLPEVPEEI